MTPSPLRARFWLLAIFVLSGFAGLIYQSIWSHYLGLFLGHAAYAQALVLAIFMGGMAAGAAWIAKAGQKWRNLIRGYAVIEAIIGVFGLLFHWIFTSLASFSYEWLIPALGEPWAVNLARWIMAALLILPQTILLGMTFPLMSGGLIRRYPGSDGNLLGGLYFTNSIGAAIGALAAVFVLLPWVGLPGAMITAGILNFAVAGLAWWLARAPEPAAPEQVSTAPTPEQRLHHNPTLRLVLVGTALSGAASFIYEIVWIRMLSMAVGSTMHAFELMLASFIAGIALGGLWVRKQADKTRSPLQLVGWMQIFMGVAALASLAVYANAFTWVGWLISSLAKTDGGYALYNLGTAALSILIMLPAAFFAGTTLPLFTITLLREGHGERAIGRVYAWNTLGAIAGVFAAIHLLIPNVGLKFALCIAALIDLIIGLVLLRFGVDNKRAMIRFAVAASIAVVALIAAVRVPYDPMTLASGVFRHGKSFIDAASRKVLYYKDGKTSSIAAIAGTDGSVSIVTNGKPDAAIIIKDGVPPGPDELTMTLAAVAPLSMMEKPDRVGVIGFGSGMTTHTLLGDPRVKHVDTIEIESAMIDGARIFGDRVARAYSDPRSNIVVEDAKAFFSSSKKYDLIISEPSNPWINGVGSLFSKEFYQFVPRSLNENGLFVQWIQLYEINEELVGSIFNSLAPHFSDYSAWLSATNDMLIIATPKGSLPKTDLSRLISTQGPLQAELARLGIASQEHLDFHRLADSRILRAFGRMYGDLPLNSDYHPVLGLNAPRARFLGASADALGTLQAQETLMLEALGVRAPLPMSIQPVRFHHRVADDFTLRARTLAAELNGKGNAAESAANADQRQVLSSARLLTAAGAQACGRSWDAPSTRELSARMREVAGLTNAFLPKEALEDIWVRRSWLACDIARADMHRVFQLLRVIAAKDWKSMVSAGTDWFERPVEDVSIHNDFSDLARSAVLLGLAHAGQWQQLLDADKKFGASTRFSAPYLLQFEALRLIAREQLQTRPQ